MRVIIFLLLLIALLSLKVNAISVVSDYLVNNTMELIEGTSKIYSIRLQNPTESEVGVKLDYDKTFMRAIEEKDVYILPPKETGYRIAFNITAPKKPGLHQIGYTVSEVESSGGGLPIRLKINKNFNLKISEEPNKFHINYDYVAYAAISSIIILSALLYVFWNKYGRKRAKPKSRKFKMSKKIHKSRFSKSKIEK